MSKKLKRQAKELIEKEGIKSRSELQKKNCGLYNALRKKNLMDEVLPMKANARNWKNMSDQELVGMAKKLIKEKGIKSRSELVESDASLYDTLRKRKLDPFSGKK